MEIPRFRLYGEDDANVEQALQPTLALRGWDEIDEAEKKNALIYIRNLGWIRDQREVLSTILYLNHHFLRECPGKKLHKILPQRSEYHSGNVGEQRKAALEDFIAIFVQQSGVMVLRMLSVFASEHIDGFALKNAAKESDATKRESLIDGAFQKFDGLASCFNHVFEQFAVNQFVTRNGFVPRQDAAITTNVYVPTLAALADPRWKPVSDDLAAAFEDYRNKNAPEAITKAHTAVQRFLQILVGEEGKNGKGEVGKLYQEAKQKKLIPVNQLTEPLVNVIKSFIVSERATNSTAKPTLTDATPSDALLVMNTVMVFLQFCLQAR